MPIDPVQKQADQAKAELGLANSFLKQMMPKQAPMEEDMGEGEMPVEGQNEPNMGENEGTEQELTVKDLNKFKGEIGKVIDKKFNELTKVLEDALEED